MPISKEDFTELVKAAIDTGENMVQDIADEIGWLPGTIKKWAKGKSVPPQLVRDRVAKYIRGRIL